MARETLIDATALKRVFGMDLGSSAPITQDLFIQLVKSKYGLSFRRIVPHPKRGEVVMDTVLKFIATIVTEYVGRQLNMGKDEHERFIRVSTPGDAIRLSVCPTVGVTFKTNGISANVANAIWTVAVSMSKLTDDQYLEILEECAEHMKGTRAAYQPHSESFFTRGLYSYLKRLVDRVTPPSIEAGVQMDTVDKDEEDEEEEEDEAEEGEEGEATEDGADEPLAEKSPVRRVTRVTVIDDGDNGDDDGDGAGTGDDDDQSVETVTHDRAPDEDEEDAEGDRDEEDAEGDKDEEDAEGDGICDHRTESYECNIITLSGLDKIFHTSIIHNDTSVKRKDDPDSIVFFTYEGDAVGNGKFTEVKRCGTKSVVATATRVVVNFLNSDEGLVHQLRVIKQTFPNCKVEVVRFSSQRSRIAIFYYLSNLGVIPEGINARESPVGKWWVSHSDDVDIPLKKVVSLFTMADFDKKIRRVVQETLTEKDISFERLIDVVENTVVHAAETKRKRGRPKKNTSPPGVEDDVEKIGTQQSNKRTRSSRPSGPSKVPRAQGVGTSSRPPSAKKSLPFSGNGDSGNGDSGNGDGDGDAARTLVGLHTSREHEDDDYPKTLSDAVGRLEMWAHNGYGPMIDEETVMFIFDVAKRCRHITPSDVVENVKSKEFIELVRVLFGKIVDRKEHAFGDADLLSFFVTVFLKTNADERLKRAVNSYRQSFGDGITDVTPLSRQ
jgi:hypothetical protein